MVNLVAAGLTELKLREYRFSPNYTAPEVLDGSEVLSKEADVFSFAMVMVMVSRGCFSWADCWVISSSLPTQVFDLSQPFVHMPHSKVEAAIKDGVRPPRPTHRGLADELWELIERCWDADPRRRPGVSTVLRTLRGLLVPFLSSKSSIHWEIPIHQPKGEYGTG